MMGIFFYLNKTSSLFTHQGQISVTARRVFIFDPGFTVALQFMGTHKQYELQTQN